MRQSTRALVLSVALIGTALSGMAQAHHSRAAFQLDQTTTMKVTVTRVRWSNPHVFYEGTVLNGKGQPESWVFEGHSISGLVRLGWSKDTIHEGDQVQMIVNRHKDPAKNFGLIDHVITPDGVTRYSVGIPPRAPNADRPAIAASKDFSGNWRFRFSGTPEEVRKRVLLGSGGPPLDRPYTAKGKAQAAAHDPSANPALTCEPISLPQILMTVYEYRWIRQGDRIVIQKEQYNDSTRTIHLKNSARPASYQPNPLGFSVGRFEPDGTLVVETSGFSAVRWGNAAGVDSSEKKKITERYKLSEDGLSLSLTYTLEDPDYYTAPVTGSGTFTKSADASFAAQPPCDLEAARQHLKFDKDEPR